MWFLSQQGASKNSNICKVTIINKTKDLIYSVTFRMNAVKKKLSESAFHAAVSITKREGVKQLLDQLLLRSVILKSRINS